MSQSLFASTFMYQRIIKLSSGLGRIAKHEKNNIFEMISDIAAESVNLNFMGGSFSISYDTVNEVYKVFQDSFDQFM